MNLKINNVLAAAHQPARTEGHVHKHGLWTHWTNINLTNGQTLRSDHFLSRIL